MNIVFFSRHFYPHVGGVEKHVLNISKILLKKHKITVFTEKFDSSLPDTELYRGIKIIRIPVSGDEKQKKYEIWKFLESRREILKKADIVHVHDVFFWYFPFRFVYPGKKVFVTFHGYEGNDLPTRKAILSHKIAEKLTKGNICVGDYLQKWYGTKPDIVTYGAIEPVSNLQQTNAGFSKRRALRILYVGRLEAEAGIMEYLQLSKRLQNKGHVLKISVLGDGALRKAAEKYALRHGLPVKFFGFVNEVEKFLPDTDIVFTSRYLGTLESLSFQKPVFCIYNNAIKRDCFVLSPFVDFIYHGDNPVQLEVDFEHYLQNPKASIIKTKNGYNWVSQQTWQKLAAAYLSLWRKK